MNHPKLVESMLNPEFYPHKPDSVELIQTHISFIFIAGDMVYKVKKAVDFGFLDFTTLGKRKYYCDEELRLNRRLARDVYRTVVRIIEDNDGNLHLLNGDNIVEYAVEMKKIPENRMLYNMLADKKVDATVMDTIARKVFEFHKSADTGGEIDRIGGIETIRHNHDENFEQTADYINTTIPDKQYQFIKSYATEFLDRKRDLFETRVRDHKIRDCHGDLHLQHICLSDDILIFDCIEFNERFRYLDVAAEVAFLSMDLDFNGYPEYADAFIKSYINYSSDEEIQTLLNFYKCYFAYVRGKVIGFKINDSAITVDEREAATATAARYFNLAYTYAARLEKPTLIITAGLMGTGKSVVAGNIASLLGVEVIRTDVVRKAILGIPQTERHHEDFGGGIYSHETTRKTYATALEEAYTILNNGKSVIIDASFKDREERKQAWDVASHCDADFFVVECVCPEDILKERLENRMNDTQEVSDGRWEIFQAQKDTFDTINEIPALSHIVVDTSQSIEISTQYVIDRIKAGIGL